MNVARYRLVAASVIAGVLMGCNEVRDDRYAEHLVLLSISPQEASTSGGTLLKLTGGRFCKTMELRVDDQKPVSVQSVSSWEAEVTAPAHPPGVVSVCIECVYKAAKDCGTLRYVPDTVVLALGESGLANALYGDVNDDGIADAWVESGTSIDVQVRPTYTLYLGRGRAGELDPKPTMSISIEPAAPPRLYSGLWTPRFFSADFTADGSTDVLVLGDAYSQAEVLRGHLFVAESGFTEERKFDIVGRELADPWLMRVVDLDGDGWQDLVVADDAYPNTIEVLHGTGPTTFDPPMPLLEGHSSVIEYFEQRLLNPQNGGPERVDFNADGVSDLLFATSSRTPLFGAYEGIFVTGDRMRNYGIVPVSVPANQGLVYFDSDGFLDRVGIDLATAASPTRVVHVWPGTGTGEFSATPLDFQVSCLPGICPELTTPEISAAFWPLRFDVDADGAGEFILLNARGPHGTGSGPNIVQAVWLELGPDPRAADALLLGAFPENHVAAEKDLYQPLLRAVARGPNGSVRVTTDVGVTFVVPSSTPGFLVARLLPPFGVGAATQPCLGDFTGDGLADVLVVDHGTRLYAGTGPAWLAAAPTQSPEIVASSCTPVQLRANGNLDFFTPSTVYRNLGSGGFVEAAPTLDGRAVSEITFVAPLDVDDDGDDELVAHALVASANAGTNAPKVWLFDTDAAGKLRVAMSGEFPGARQGDGSRTSLEVAQSAVYEDLNDDRVLDVALCAQDGDLRVLGGNLDSQVAADTLSFDFLYHAAVLDTGCEWLRLLGDSHAWRLLTNDGSIVRSDESSVGATTADALVFPDGIQLEHSQVAVCNLYGRGPLDLVLVAAGLFGHTLWQPRQNPERWVFNAIEWIDLEPLGLTAPRFMGCMDADGDGLDDVVVQDSATLELFLVRNISGRHP